MFFWCNKQIKNFWNETIYHFVVKFLKNLKKSFARHHIRNRPPKNKVYFYQCLFYNNSLKANLIVVNMKANVNNLTKITSLSKIKITFKLTTIKKSLLTNQSINCPKIIISLNSNFSIGLIFFSMSSVFNIFWFS